MAQSLDLDDIQGLILHGYGELDDAYFVMLSIDDVAAAKRWLAEMAGEVRNSISRPYDPLCNVAFTIQGLRRLGVSDDAIGLFAREFQEGMSTPHRRRALGDHGDSAPERWRWGRPDENDSHVLLMLYANGETALQQLYDAHAPRFIAGGLREVHRLRSLTLEGRKEHFGFRDGIGQPIVEGIDKPGPDSNRVKAGEFILGYPNEYGQYSDRPLVPADGPGSLLPKAEDNPDLRDLGRNGTYMVFRQMAQDVHAFWSYLDGATRKPDDTSDPSAMIELASKMVGRWPSGAPLANSPSSDDPALQDDDNFLYHEADPDGYATPSASHIRRTNPRDMLGPDPGSKKSIAIGNRHRILRRGRAYGTPLAASMDPVDMLAAGDDGEERGLQFICFNTNIGRQFEFLYQTWVNNPRFAGTYNEPDPVIGDMDPQDDGGQGEFRVPQRPVRDRYTGLSRPVTIKGGAFFFFPGIRAVRYLSALP